jgi:hypothetical protein
MAQVERELIRMKHEHSLTKRQTTSCKDVLQFLVDNHKERIWWWSWELVAKPTSTGGWISHRGPARASDLALHNPELVEHVKVGRFAMYRVRRENREQVINYLNSK